MLNQPFVIPSILFVLFSLPLILGLVPRQGWYGVRTKKTLSDDAIWYAANRFAGWVLFSAGLVYLAVAWFLPCLSPCGGTNFGQWLIHLAAFGLPLLAGLMLIRAYIRSL